jgi:selenocysteine-specific elongation factor
VRSVVIGTAGHIDHGKSALVQALTGTNPDRLKEERERGITIDLGFAHAEIAGINLAFVDVPGHERFVKNMLAGAGGIDLVLLVVAADESIMPQTREHFQICRLLHVRSGVVVITKADLADRDTIELVTLELRDMVEGSFLADAPVLPVSSRTGDGLDALKAALVKISGTLAQRSVDGFPRLPIDRVFSVKGFGTVVTGTLVSGHLETDGDCVVLPRGRDVKVRGLQAHGHQITTAGAGMRVAANLGGVDVADLGRGDTLCAAATFEPTRRIDVALEMLADARPLRTGARVRFHYGTTELLGRVAVIQSKPEAEAIDARPAVYARLRLESAAVVTRGDRFILRAYSPLATIGGGIVIDPQPPNGGLRTAANIARLARLDLNRVPTPGHHDDAVIEFVEERRAAGLEKRALVSRAGLSASESERTMERLTRSGKVTLVGDLLVSAAVLTDLRGRVLSALEAHHAANPLSDGIPREEAREKLFRKAAPQVFDAVVESLVKEGRLVARDRLALHGHSVSLTPEEAAARDAIERVYREAKLAPPESGGAAAAAGASPAVAERVVALMLRDRTLVKIDTLVFHRAALDDLKADVRRLKNAGGTARVDVAAFKERYGVTRKFAIPLLEYLDRERVTRRVGDARIVL